ncbi:MAG: HlyC/CorC family transporter [Micrococcaceae bacterium]|nr:HlyC/CorC family transporter [Micrococcaceae bacterium]
MAVPIVLALLFLLSLALTWVLTLAESAFDYLSYREAEAIVAKRPSNPVLRIMDRLPEHQLATRFWNAVFLAATAVLITVFIDHFVNNVWLSAAGGVVLMAVITLVISFRSPRRIGAKHFEVSAEATAWLIRLLTIVLGPIPRLFISEAETDDEDETDDTDLEERHFREYVSRASAADVLEDDEAEMIQSVFEMDDTLVRAIMVPRTDVVWLDSGTSLAEATEVFIRSGYSRIPLIGENPDDVLGIVFLKDIIRATHTASLTPQEPVNMLTREIRVVPESKTVWDLLQELQREAIHAAIVIDEYGGTAGFVTLEDLIEELVGDISDEYDDAEIADVIPQPDGEFLVNASMSVSDFYEAFDLLLDDEDDVDTVGGLFAKSLGKIPIKGSVTEVENLKLTVESLTGRRNRVDTIRVAIDTSTQESTL